MHGKVWMFSNLIDDEDIEFMQHEFISYDIVNIGLHFFLKNVRPYAASCSEA